MEAQILQLFINNIPQFIFWKDKDSVYLGCNNNFAHSSGFDNPEAVIGKTDYDMPWSKEEADFFRKIDKEVMDSAQPQFNFEEPQTQADGEIRWLSTSKTPLYDDEGLVCGILGWYIDITDYKRMEVQIDAKNKALVEYGLQLEKSKKELELANYDLEKFTYAASHDLKSPIRSIVSFAQLLKEENKNEKLNEYIDFIVNSGRRMNRLVEDILTYARTGNQDLTAEKVLIQDIINTKILDLRPLINDKAAVIHYDLPDESIACFPPLIGIVYYNLINNAIKFNESTPPEIFCSYQEKSDYWVFSVKDNGIGIAPSALEKIFEPFKRFVGHDYEGSGIGLSICKRIAHMHKGKIWAEHNPDGGTTFLFSISKRL